MSTGAFFLLIVQAVVFLVWTVLMFRTLFLLTRRARKDTGQALPGPLASLTQWRYWLTSQEDRRARMTLGLVTLLLFALIFAFAMLA